MSTSTFTGQAAVVSGASSGIGRAIAVRLAAEGATVCMIGRRLSSLQRVAEEAACDKSRFVAFEMDLERDEDVPRLLSLITRHLGGIDILVHSAGIITLGNVAAADVSDFDRQYRVNVRGPYLLTQALLPVLRARKGQVVFINSSLGLRARAGSAGYAASKHALKAVADALRDEVNDDGVRVLSVYPGRTATPMQAELSRVQGRLYAPAALMQPEDVARVVLDALRLDRTAEMTDIQVRPARKPE